MVITGLTRNQFVGNTGTWVRIPPRPPITRFLLEAKTLFFFMSSLKKFPRGILQGLQHLIKRLMTIPLMLHQDENRYLPLLKNHCVRATLVYLLVLFHRAFPYLAITKHKYGLNRESVSHAYYSFLKAVSKPV